MNNPWSISSFSRTGRDFPELLRQCFKGAPFSFAGATFGTFQMDIPDFQFSKHVQDVAGSSKLHRERANEIKQSARPLALVLDILAASTRANLSHRYFRLLVQACCAVLKEIQPEWAGHAQDTEILGLLNPPNSIYHVYILDLFAEVTNRLSKDAKEVKRMFQVCLDAESCAKELVFLVGTFGYSPDWFTYEACICDLAKSRKVDVIISLCGLEPDGLAQALSIVEKSCFRILGSLRSCLSRNSLHHQVRGIGSNLGAEAKVGKKLLEKADVPLANFPGILSGVRMGPLNYIGHTLARVDLATCTQDMRTEIVQRLTGIVKIGVTEQLDWMPLYLLVFLAKSKNVCSLWYLFHLRLIVPFLVYRFSRLLICRY